MFAPLLYCRRADHSRMRTAPGTLLALAVAFGALAVSRARAGSRTPGSPAPANAYFGDTTPPDGQVFRFNHGAEPETIDPGLATGQPDGRVARILFEGPDPRDPKTLEPRPGQAYRWEMSPDGLTYTFHLRPGLVWSDGTPLTAARLPSGRGCACSKPETAARYAGLLVPDRERRGLQQGRAHGRAQVGIAAPDDSTFVVRLERADRVLPVPHPVLHAPAGAAHGDREARRPLDAAREHRLQRPVPARPTGGRTTASSSCGTRRYWDAASVKLDGIVAYTVDDLNTCDQPLQGRRDRLEPERLHPVASSSPTCGTSPTTATAATRASTSTRST